MTLRTVGLLGLVAAHLNAFALPSPCLKNYRKAALDLHKKVDSLTYQKNSVLAAGGGGAVIGGGVCLLRLRSIAGLFICPVFFGGIGYVAWNYAEDLENQIFLATESATIYELYLDFKTNGRKTDLEVQSLAYMNRDLSKDQAIEAAWIKLLEDGELCDSKGRPNKTFAEAAALTKSKID